VISASFVTRRPAALALALQMARLIKLDGNLIHSAVFIDLTVLAMDVDRRPDQRHLNALTVRSPISLTRWSKTAKPITTTFFM